MLYKKHVKIENAIISICIAIVILLVVEHYQMKNMVERLRTYKYLSTYHCYITEFKTTQYTLAKNECSKSRNHQFYGITRSGYRAVKYRTVAVDEKVVALGSVLIDVQTGHLYIAEDTGNQVRGYHLDLFVGEGTKENVKQAIDYGVQYREFVVIEPDGVKY